MTDPAALFDADFGARAPRLGCRPETQDDQPFLVAQFIACSPMTAVLPPALIAQQAAFQLRAHAGAYPHAMRRIATLKGTPIGRFAIDWTADNGHGIDLAVLPQHRATGAGLHFLRAWIVACDATGRSATLDVMAGNPVARIYARLGFRATPEAGLGASIAMRRPASAPEQAAADQQERP